MAKNTEAQIADVQERLAGVQAELDALNLGTAPTADLEAEEREALRRLARKEALSRVSSALSAELAELQNRLAAEKEAERQRQAAKLQAEMDKAREVAEQALWDAYEAIEAWKQAGNELEKVSPSYGTHTSKPSNASSKLISIMSGLGIASQSVGAHDVSVKRTA